MKILLVPTTGDPFVLNYWLHFYKKNIKPYVDRTFIGQYGPTDPTLVELSRQLCEENDIKFTSKTSTKHGAGESLEVAFESIDCKPTKIALLETDCFVFSNIFQRHINKIQKGELIGSVRNGHTNMDFSSPNNKTETWATNTMWPCFLFTDFNLFRDVYNEVKKHIDPKLSVTGGRYNPEVVFHNSRGNEEFASFSIVLQHRASKFTTIPQLRATSSKKPPDWVHFGKLDQLCLSGNVLRDSNNISLIFGPQGRPHKDSLASHPTGKLESPMYIGMFKACVMHASRDERFKDLIPQYLEAIETSIKTFGYSRPEIERYCNEFLEWLK